MRRPPPLPLALIAGLLGPALWAGGYEMPWKQVLPDHVHPVFEARVDTVLGPQAGESPRRTRVRLRTIRVHQGRVPRTMEARFTLTGSFGSTDEAALAARREALGLVPGRRILVVVSPLGDDGREWVGASLGDPDGTGLAAREGDEGGLSAVDYVRAHLAPERRHDPPGPPTAGGAFGQ